MTDLKPEQIEDVLSPKEWGFYKRAKRAHPGVFVQVAETLVSLAKERIENRRLRKAIKPFADFCKGFDGKHSNLATEDHHVVYEFERISITLGHLRNANQALLEGEAKDD